MTDIIAYTPSQSLANEFPEFAKVNIYGTSENPLFPVRQVQEFLGTAQIRLDQGGYELGNDYTQTECIGRDGKSRVQNLLTEEGLYRVLFTTDTPVSKKFRTFTKVVMRELRLRGQVNLEDAISKLHKVETENKMLNDQLEEEHVKVVQYRAESEKFFRQKMAAIERTAILEMRNQYSESAKPNAEYQLEKLKEKFMKKIYVYLTKPPKSIADEFSDFDNLDPVDDEEICFEIAFQQRSESECAEMYIYKSMKMPELVAKLHEHNFTILADEKIHPKKFRGTIDELRQLVDKLI